MKKANHKKHGLVNIIDYKRGWYTCETEDGALVKSRAKDLEVIDEPKVEETQGYVQAGKVKYKKANYTRGLAAAPCGAPTVDIDDHVARLLRGLSVDETIEAVAGWLAQLEGPKVLSRAMQKAFEGPWEAGNIAAFLNKKYSHLNNGMVRMNCGNVLRAAMKRGEK
jgi:hypothetical protein